MVPQDIHIVHVFVFLSILWPNSLEHLTVHCVQCVDEDPFLTNKYKWKVLKTYIKHVPNYLSVRAQL